jgi:ABC-2 type transport system ATP-binding protein
MIPVPASGAAESNRLPKGAPAAVVERDSRPRGLGLGAVVRSERGTVELVIDGVSKRYKGNVWGLRDLSLQLEPGVLALVGPNGAGKSTLMRILATITKPTAGQVLWNGSDIVRSPNDVRAVLGYLPQDFGIYPHLNTVEFLEYMAALKGMDGQTARRRIRELLHVVNLFDVRKRPLGDFSGGMKQRVGVAQALLNDPQLLIVDEPTAGLDPEERVRFRNLLSDLVGERIVILATHIVSDAEATATEVALIDQGVLLEHAEPERLLQAVDGRVWEWVIPSAELTAAKQQHIVSSTARGSDGLHLRVISETPPGPDARATTPTLEDAYLYFMSSANGTRAPTGPPAPARPTVPINPMAPVKMTRSSTSMAPVKMTGGENDP